MVRASLLYGYRCLAIPSGQTIENLHLSFCPVCKKNHMCKITPNLISQEQIESLKARFNSTEKLYHYTSFENALKILVTRKLKFSKLNNLNDINEAYRTEYIDVSDSQILSSDLERSDSYLENGVITKALQKFRQISLSMDEVNKPGFAISSMWGHYAQKGTGVCLVFDKNKLISKLKPDEYGTVRYKEGVDGSIKIPIDKIADCVNFIDTRRQEFFFTKLPDWSCEQEFRIVKLFKRNTDACLNIKEALMAIIVYDFQTDKYENSIRKAKSSLLQTLSENKVCVCNYGSFLGDYSLYCQGGAIWCSR